ncbi:DUF262 domain-containing protein [Pedobacter sp. UYP30]|uniref:DUF262 domain-containing protein n=1 Tax=Pedobacter sp. UYP30 TaxID=1756400 RepID=UPI003399DD99
MEYRIETWKIKHLLEKLEQKKLDLNPPYQRNAIWTKTTQKFLINSIKAGIPVPNIFLFEKNDKDYEMVDGQQRTRAIHLYNSTNEINLTANASDAEFKTGKFLEYEIPVTIITKVEENESIEDFYYMVNTSGVKLNRPEQIKARYSESNFLKLVNDITYSDSFSDLNIIPATSQKRMLDRDLVEELCTLVIFGITDKKLQVDKLYSTDISNEDEKECRTKFTQILKILSRFDSIRTIKNTRYRQRNDFYTLFGFIKDNLSLENNSLDYFYKLLLILEKGIRPNKDSCPPLAEYAFNCVSQSNSASARMRRLDIFNNIFLNSKDIPNEMQDAVKSHYQIEGDYFKKVENYLTFNDVILAEAMRVFELNDSI